MNFLADGTGPLAYTISEVALDGYTGEMGHLGIL